PSHHQIAPQVERRCVNCERLPRNQARPKLRQLSFSLILKMSKKMLRYDKLQNRIAKKFQTLIVEMIPLCLMSQARMRERLRQQERIAELVTDAVFERIHGRAKAYANVLIFPRSGGLQSGVCKRAVWKAPPLGS